MEIISYIASLVISFFVIASFVGIAFTFSLIPTSATAFFLGKALKRDISSREFFLLATCMFLLLCAYAAHVYMNQEDYFKIVEPKYPSIPDIDYESSYDERQSRETCYDNKGAYGCDE